MRKYTAIPEPTKSIDNLFETVKALKQAVEEMNGSAGKINMSRTYVEDRPPTGVNRGDLWINQSGMYFWNGQDWQAVP